MKTPTMTPAEVQQVEQQLTRLEKLTDMQLYQALVAMESDPAPEWCKVLVAKKVNAIMNQRLGL